MHVCLGVPGANRVQEGCEVVQIHRLVRRAGIEHNDISRRCRAGDRPGGGLRASWFRGNVRVSIRPAAQKRHDIAVDAGLREMNVQTTVDPSIPTK
jgi:hypothetical protein